MLKKLKEDTKYIHKNGLNILALVKLLNYIAFYVKFLILLYLRY